MDPSEGARQEPDARQGITNSGRRIDSSVGVRDGAIQDGQDHDDQSGSPDSLGHAGPRIATVEADEVLDHLAWPKVHAGSVVAEHVEKADQQRRQDDGPGDRLARFFRLFGQWGGGLEADKGEDGEDHRGKYRAESLGVAGTRSKDCYGV